MSTLHIDVWSDIACPWCYVGKRRLEEALSRFHERENVAIIWRAFELDRTAPPSAHNTTSYAERLATKYRSSVKEAENMISRMVGVAKEAGLDFRFDQISPGNTFDAHRVLHLAAQSGKQDALKERLFQAYFTEGAFMSDHETLVRLAAEIGIEAETVRTALAENTCAEAVREEEELASELGIRGVPFFVFGGRYAVSGAQASTALLAALHQAWSDPEARKSVLQTREN